MNTPLFILLAHHLKENISSRKGRFG